MSRSHDALANVDADPGTDGWRLEVVRGRDVGRGYRVPPGPAETVLGAGLDEVGASGIDLRDQETSPTRRMAARQAALLPTGAGLMVRDLGAPGGTFVNRQRLLSDQPRALQPGDVIQLAAVQLRVARAPATTAAPITAPARPTTAAPTPSNAPLPSSPSAELPVPFVLEGGGQSCRRWDDFLTVAAQRWEDLRAELASGRLAEHLRRAGRADLAPGPIEGQSDDERLDHWLARIPSARSSEPELDIHPEEIEISTAIAGGTVRQVVRITNVGYRRLRWTARIEPAGLNWLRLAPEDAGRWCFTIEATDLPVLFDVPERLDRPLSAAIAIESNGGTRRIAVRIVQKPRPSSMGPEAELDLAGNASSFIRANNGRSFWASELAPRATAVRPAARVVAGALAGLGARALMMTGAGGGTSASGPGPSLASAGPSLSALALVMAVLGAFAALMTPMFGRGARGRPNPSPAETRWSDAGPLAFAGACLGLLAAAIVHAAVSSVEAALGNIGGGMLARSPWTALMLWMAIGGALAALSCWMVPYRPDNTEPGPCP